MNSIHNSLSPFELLPELVMGTIFDQLNQITGSQGVLNKADIPVIMRNARSLACTSKTMAAKVNHPIVINLFLQSLSNKYNESCEHFAALLDSIGARVWIWQHIQKNGDDKTYQVIQDIYELAAEALREADKAGLEFKHSEGRKGWPSPNPYYYQTKQGFALYIDREPRDLATPFGDIKIYGGGSSSGTSRFSISEFFIRRLNAVFEHVTPDGIIGKNKDEIYEIAASSGAHDIRKIKEEEIKRINANKLEDKRGTKNLIVSLCGNDSVYKVRNVKGQETPDLLWHDSEQSIRSSEAIKKIWEMLEANRLGLDPIAKEIKSTENKNQRVTEEPFFKNISEVSEWAIELVAKLVQQPIFEGETWLSCKTKLLVMPDYSDARAIEILHSAAATFLDKDSKWRVHTFGCGNNCRFLNGKNQGFGIELWSDDGDMPCSIDALRKAYDSVIEGISRNWIRSELKDYPAILHTESEEDYALFIKKENIICEEDVLIRCLSSQLGVFKSITCYKNGLGENLKYIYLWIKKDSLNRTLDVLNIIPKHL